MRRIVVERAREKKTLKRGGDWERIEFDSSDISDAARLECGDPTYPHQVNVGFGFREIPVLMVDD